MKRLLPHMMMMTLLLVSCEQITPVYPDEPVINYKEFSMFIKVDELNNKTLVGRLSFYFTDGDGNVGMMPVTDSLNFTLPDTLKYNFFIQMYDLQGYEFVQVPENEGGLLKYRIPYLDNKPLSGTIELDISYPVIRHDTIFYTFYIYDRDYNRSNTDTTDVIYLSGYDLNEI